MTDDDRPELPHWSTYDSVGAWYRDRIGRVPVQMAHSIDRTMKLRGLTFREAYRLLLRGGAIIHIDPTDDIEPDELPIAGEPESK